MIARKPNPHIASGHGIHMSLGSPLVRLEFEVALKLFVEMFGDKRISIDGECMELMSSFIIHGLKNLPLCVDQVEL